MYIVGAIEDVYFIIRNPEIQRPIVNLADSNRR